MYQRKMPKRALYIIFILRGIAAGLFMLGGILAIVSAYPIFKSEISYSLKQKQAEAAITETTNIIKDRSSFGEILLIPPTLKQPPANTSGSIVIEKIDVNVPVVWNVSVSDKNTYLKALEQGVAHADGSSRPAKTAGNTYLFSHSTLNPLEIERYSASFTLLHRLEIGDRITVFSDSVRYDYEVEGKEIVKGFNTEPLTRIPDHPILTLQTCDPPGIPLNRLIITAKLLNVYNNGN